MTGNLPKYGGGVRIRRSTLALFAAGLLALAGCGSEEPRSAQPKPGEVSPEALLTKANALTADPCFRAPEQQKYWLCEKYVTQLGSFTGTVNKLAETFVALREPGQQLRTGIDAYRGAGCEAETAPEPAVCLRHLDQLKTGLDTVRTRLRDAPTATE
ncbi:hypothetical protein [Amycolatopsis magusensis]|uniref:Uncharacterized protein n=1 Tax=Amycolatopsis magusensis TaxID=882444 RepID=A0ABS4PMX0_9PSEU|nr:hypothetical protein [Amycolatopsis magusensis]MBP2180777.1 hypothetical protein [Amycolatopsis magusensis]MDI5977427.1 hypothetical protein [Amycolatopsis magusensis]